MKTHTSSFKEQIKLMGKEIDSRITFGNTVLGKDDLNAVTPSYQGAILKSVMKQLDIDSNVEIPIGTNLKYEFGLKVNDEYEYIDYGNYIVYSVEKQEDTNSYKIVCYDKLLLSMKDYVKLPITYPISIRDYINAISTALGLKFANKNDEFANYDKQIQVDLYDGLGYTFRDVLDELAQVTASIICLNNNDELEIRYITETGDTIDEEFLKDVNVNFGEKFGPINTIVLSRSAGSDNIYYPENLPDEPYELKISDNQIMNFNDRSDYLPDIYNKLNGLEFYTNDFVSTGICYYDLCDRYSVKVGNNIYSCVMLNDEILVTQGLEENIFTEKPEETTTDYTKADKTDRKINQVSLIVDKQNREIEAVTNSVQDLTSFLKTIEGTNEIILENTADSSGAINKLELSGFAEKTLYPGISYPSNKVFPGKITTYIIIQENEDGTQYNETYIDLGIELLENDKLIIENNKVFVKKNNNNINTGLEVILKTFEGKTKIKVKYFDNINIACEYIEKNDFTKYFATQVDLQSQILITDEGISSKVSKAELISEINQSAEEIILKSNRLVVESDGFNLDGEGNMIATSGKIGGFELQENSLKVTHLPEESYFTQDDLVIVRDHVQNGASLTQEQITKYDFNGDGKVTAVDLLKLQNIVIIKNQNVNIEINSDDFENFINVESDNFGTSFNVSLNGTTVNSLTANDIIIKDNNGNTALNIFENGTILADMTNSEGGVWSIQNFGSQVFTVNKDGNVECVSLTQTSQEKNKKNFEKLNNALDIINRTEIYKYHLKSQNDDEKKHIGFVIGEDYNYPKEVTSINNDGVDLYSMVSVCFKAIQEQQKIIEELKEMIK